MKKVRLALFSFAAFALATVSHASPYTIDASHSSVGFTIRHIVGNVHGTFQKFSGTVDFDEKNLS